jgi:hypothetical protein
MSTRQGQLEEEKVGEGTKRTKVSITKVNTQVLCCQEDIH